MPENKTKNPIRICYLGIYEPTAVRDKVYLRGLQSRGATVLTCVDNSLGFLKFVRLAKKLWAVRGQYDILWVGYLSTMLVPLAWFVSRKKIVFNALDSWYDRTVLDRGAHARFSPAAFLIWFFDFFAFRMSDIVLVESEAQKKFITRTFLVNARKLKVVFTGVDDEVFHPDTAVPKATQFTVIFRGMFLPATGVEHVIDAARILKDENVTFVIIGWGAPIQQKIEKVIHDELLRNVIVITHFLPAEELRKRMLSAHVMLGQFGDHSRLTRTIQNKNFEALALGQPLITRDSPSNRELLTDGVDCLFVPPANPQALAEKILFLKEKGDFRLTLAHNARRTYEEKASPQKLAEVLCRALDLR